MPAKSQPPTGGRSATPHSLHLRQAPAPAPGEAAGALTKPDRLVIGLLAGAALFYLLGQALGLGQHRTSHADP